MRQISERTSSHHMGSMHYSGIRRRTQLLLQPKLIELERLRECDFLSREACHLVSPAPIHSLRLQYTPSGSSIYSPAPASSSGKTRCRCGRGAHACQSNAQPLHWVWRCRFGVLAILHKAAAPFISRKTTAPALLNTHTNRPGGLVAQNRRKKAYLVTRT